MSRQDLALDWLISETRGLLARLDAVRPFALVIPTVAAGRISPAALQAVELSQFRSRRSLREDAREFLASLQPGVDPELAQRRFSFLRLRFNAMLTQLDIFSDAFVQRSEHVYGVRLAGLDATARDTLSLPRHPLEAPPVVCYLDRGHGAAIRRARTRLPGGGDSPIALIRIPRERMVGSGIASSLIHEVGHQAAALLDIFPQLRLYLMRRRRQSGANSPWRYWERWITEIFADLWAMAKLGLAATLGMIAVLSLPRAFIFRGGVDDPHPIPWIRVKLSCALGRGMYASFPWDRTAALWDSLYPAANLPGEARDLLRDLELSLPEFTEYLLDFHPETLAGASLGEALYEPEREPAQLRELFRSWRSAPGRMLAAPPSLAFAALGLSRFEGQLTPEQETRSVAALLERWALMETFGRSPGRLDTDQARRTLS